MQKTIPHLWYDKEAKEAAELYTSVFPDSRIVHEMTLPDTPSGDTGIVTFELAGQRFQAISAGPVFKFNPSVSFQVKCRHKDEVDAIWNHLSQGGMALMELGEYPFSERFGWVQDKYGLSWQVMYTGESRVTQKITPMLLFVGAVCGKAEEAINFYASVFPNGKANVMDRYGKGEQPDQEGTVKQASFTLFGQKFGAMDSAFDHKFAFNEAISFIVNCDTQDEIDYYWERLTSGGGEESVCGWLKDRYGLSWQIVPTAMDEMMQIGTQEQIGRVTEAFLKMKKFDLAELQKAYEGSS